LLGAIIGDVVGSRFEFNNHRSKDFELFTEDCQVTDDSIMTLAVAKGIMEAEKLIKPTFGRYAFNSEYYSLVESMTIKYMQEIGRRYPNCGYGGMFSHWVFSDDPEPYNSFGNGAAMRISPVGFAARTESEACTLSEAVTGVTHNHSEGIKGAEATAVAIYMANRGFTKEEIRHKIERDYYELDFRIDDIRDTYQFNETCQDTVPQAIQAFLESTSFEDAIRTAISLGGDSDTLAAITGSIAEAYYGVPKDIRDKALNYLNRDLRAIYDEWYEFIGNEGEISKFKSLTKYIGKISEAESYGDWLMDRENDGTPEHPFHMPIVHFSEIVNSFVADFYLFSENHPEYQLTEYILILERNGLNRGGESMQKVDVDALDEQCILALMMEAIRADRFCEGALLSFFNDGSTLKCLKRLKAIDDRNALAPITEIYFEIGGNGGYDTYRFTFDNNVGLLITTPWYQQSIENQFSSEETMMLLEAFKALHVEYWNSEYINPSVCDGTLWELAVKFEGQRGIVWAGCNAFPDNWDDLLSFFGIDYEDDEED
jgi:ADP-ribosyl-[dinitrogen reductase] hydrolase